MKARNQARLTVPGKVAVAAEGTLYIADTNNLLISEVAAAKTTTGEVGHQGTSERGACTEHQLR